MPTSDPPILLVAASPLEAAAIARGLGATPQAAPEWAVQRLNQRICLVVSGVGKANAAACTARAMARGRYQAILSVGIAGMLPGSGLALGDAVLATRSIYADEGIVTESGFMTCEAMGFPLGPCLGGAVDGDGDMLRALRPIVDKEGDIATVSTCSGTNPLAEQVVERTGAIAEAMEGAAIGHAVRRYSDLSPRRGSRFAEVRVVSNTTGDRSVQQWAMKAALRKLSDLAAALPRALGYTE